MFSACGRHQADRNILHPWNNSSLPHPVSTTHILLAAALPVGSSVSHTLHNSPGQLKGIKQAPFVMVCSFPKPVIPGLSFPSCHLYLSCSEQGCVTGLCWSLLPRNGAALHSAGSTLSVRGSLRSAWMYQKIVMWALAPFSLPPLETFLQRQGHSGTDS